MIYLDNAATSRYKPSVMFDAMINQLSNSSNSGRSGHNDSIDLAIQIFESRKIIKDFFKTPDDYSLVFTQNCTEALNLAIIGYLKNFANSTCHVVTTANEHNSVLRPLYYLSQTQPLNFTVVPPDIDGSINPNAIINSITKETVMVCVNHISNVTGAITHLSPVGQYCRNNGIVFLADCAQSAGHLPIDISHTYLDFLACAGHKGLHGGQGTGFLIFNPKFKLMPLKFGGTGTNSQSLSQPLTPPEGFESGTLNSAGILGLAQSVKWTDENFHKIQLNSHYLTTELLYGLKQMPQYELYTKFNNGVVSFNRRGYDSTDIGEILNDNNIAVRCGLHCAPLIHKYLGTTERGVVRVSIGYNNSINDINYLLEILSKI